MKNQVTSIEQSKRLIEMGVPADRGEHGVVSGSRIYRERI